MNEYRTTQLENIQIDIKYHQMKHSNIVIEMILHRYVHTNITLDLQTSSLHLPRRRSVSHISTGENR